MPDATIPHPNPTLTFRETRTITSLSPSPDVKKNAAAIRIRGARQHNLKNVNVEIPRGKLVVVTGPSGSGKSSLAVDTVFAEGQRQYIETLSVYARQFLDQIPRPAIDSIEGLQPTLCIDQHLATPNRRSTVGTITEIYDYLRVIMAQVAEVHCIQCGENIQQLSQAQIAERILRLPDGTKVMLMAPIVRGKKGSHQSAFDEIHKAGLVRVRINKANFELDQRPALDPNKDHSIDAVVDRIVVREGIEDRLLESLDLALKMGEGAVVASYQSTSNQQSNAEWIDRVYSSKLSCPNCDTSYLEIEPRTFSFNSPYGACPACHGLGTKEQFDWQRTLNLQKPVGAGAILPWGRLSTTVRTKRIKQLELFFESNGIDQSVTLASLTEKQFEQFLFGDRAAFQGLAILLEKELVTATNEERLAELEQLRDKSICDQCKGSRLTVNAHAATLSGKTITDIVNLPINEAIGFFNQIELDPVKREIGQLALNEIHHRLQYLAHVGVGYLSLSRRADTLSGGEFQRVRLATSLGTGLAGVCYVLDEPTVGLHPRDNQRMIESIRGLQKNGNTVLVVEHDEEMMQACDWLIEFGPGAGEHGGSIIAEGDLDSILNNEASVTGAFLSGRRHVSHKLLDNTEETNKNVTETTARKQHSESKGQIKIQGANIHCVNHLDLDIPLGKMVAITGVSGSGKSSLVDFVLAPNLRQLAQTGELRTPEYCKSFSVPQNVTGLVTVDQTPLGRSSRSNPATYSGVFAEIRKIFAATPLAKQRGYSSTRFSYNSPDGRCADCKGHGEKKMEMKFLPELTIPCATCLGRRYNQQTLQVRYRERTIADVLEMSVDSACDFFLNFAKISKILDQLRAVGLGYLKLGQAATKLSGGEAQRIKLATELARFDEFGHTIYLLDEPTTGLGFVDIERLLDLLRQLVAQGNSVILIEHHLEVITNADWIIDLGPEGGANGGKIVAEGPPEIIAACSQSHTGRFLKLKHEADLS